MLVTKHRWYVFKLAVRAGIPWRGLVHDLSKYSPVEFFESLKYFNGSRSPILVCREKNGYSKAWVHHKSHNKHHFEYWEDISKTERKGVFMPYRYLVEAVCDKLAAGMVYNGKNWNKNEPYQYWTTIEMKAPVEKHPANIEFMNTALKSIADNGVKETLNRKYLKNLYKTVASKYKCR